MTEAILDLTEDGDWLHGEEPKKEVEAGGPGSGRHKEIGDAIREWIKISGETPDEINHGHCQQTALYVKGKVPEAKAISYPGHTFIQYDGRAYDAEHPSGVEDFRNLNRFNEDDFEGYNFDPRERQEVSVKGLKDAIEESEPVPEELRSIKSGGQGSGRHCEICNVSTKGSRCPKCNEALENYARHQGISKADALQDLKVLVARHGEFFLRKYATSFHGDLAETLKQSLHAGADEETIREWMKTWVAYAEDGPSFDPDGKYLCGTCAVRIDNGKRNGNACAPMSGTISLEAGSCRMYVHGPDKEEFAPFKHQLTQIEAQYGERPKTKRFGCSHCEYGSKADEPDSKGRPSWCSYFNVHVIPNACCAMNEGPDSINAPSEKKVQAATEESFQGDKAGALWHGIRITGFTGPQEEGLRAMLSRVPPELLKGIVEIKSASELNAKHGKYDAETNIISFNPKNFGDRTRLGKGTGSISHPELTVVHEIGHKVYQDLSPEKQAEWNAISDWVLGTQVDHAPPYVERRQGWLSHQSNWTHKFGAKFTRYYAERNPGEDFADSFAFHILGKGYQAGLEKKAFLDQYIKDNVHAYPQASIQSPRIDAGHLYNIHSGGPGSGRHKTGRKDKDKQERAKASYVPMTAAKYNIATLNEALVAKAIGGKQLNDHEPFDVEGKGFGVEVKTIFPGTKNEKITMHKSSLARKMKEAKKRNLRTYTVAVDMRSSKINVMVQKGLGSFRFVGMERVGNFSGLKGLIK